MFSFAFITSVQESWENWELKSEISSLPAEVHYFGSEIFLYFRKDLDALIFWVKLLCLFCCRASYLNICIAYWAVVQFLRLLGPDVPSETLRFL